MEIIGQFAQKRLNSGYPLEEIRRNTLSGIKGYEKKRKRCEAIGV